MIKGLNFTREKYKRVKRMDRKQMEVFMITLYKEGYQEGKKDAEPKVKFADIASVITSVKGVGTKKAAEIMAALSRLYEGGEKDAV